MRVWRYQMSNVWLMLGVGVLLAGCATEEHEDLKQWMQTQSQDMRPQLQPLPSLQTFPAIDYDAVGLVDPFQVSRLEPEKRAGQGGKRPDDNRRREPLEAYPLETLKMVGLMMMNAHPVALIQADKTIHQIKAGNYLGQNFGRVTKIDETQVVLTELIEDANGDWVERVSTIQLQERETKK